MKIFGFYVIFTSLLLVLLSIMILVLCGSSVLSEKTPKRSKKTETQLEIATRVITIITIIFSSTYSSYIITIYMKTFLIYYNKATRFFIGKYLLNLIIHLLVAFLPIIFLFTLQNKTYKKKGVKNMLILSSWFILIYGLYLISIQSIIDKSNEFIKIFRSSKERKQTLRTSIHTLTF